MYPVVPLILIYTLAFVSAARTLLVLTTTWYHVKYTKGKKGAIISNLTINQAF